jgi:hypothetical protein
MGFTKKKTSNHPVWNACDQSPNDSPVVWYGHSLVAIFGAVLMKYLPLILLTLILIGCASQNTAVVPAVDYDGPPVQKIALTNNGLLSDAVGLNLSAKGFAVSPALKGTDESSISDPQQRQLFAEAGFDALLFVKSTDDDEGRPRSATALLYAIDSGNLITGVTWENGYGFGVEGSVTNQMLRADQHEAAEKIATELARVIPR